jgi:hypothetical protein
MALTKQQRAAIKADGFVNYYHSPAAVRANREGLRSDFADYSDYWQDLAPTAAWMPDYLVTAWAELYEDEVDYWNHLLNAWPSRDMRHINTATAFVQVFLALVNGTARGPGVLVP